MKAREFFLEIIGSGFTFVCINNYQGKRHKRLKKIRPD
jgi:hypothetical protein